jgi:hypothetical protein
MSSSGTAYYDLKARIFKQVDARVSADPIIASNTSRLHHGCEHQSSISLSSIRAPLGPEM